MVGRGAREVRAEARRCAVAGCAFVADNVSAASTFARGILKPGLEDKREASDVVSKFVMPEDLPPILALRWGAASP